MQLWVTVRSDMSLVCSMMLSRIRTPGDDNYVTSVPYHNLNSAIMVILTGNNFISSRHNTDWSLQFPVTQLQNVSSSGFSVMLYGSLDFPLTPHNPCLGKRHYFGKIYEDFCPCQFSEGEGLLWRCAGVTQLDQSKQKQNTQQFHVCWFYLLPWHSTASKVVT